MIAYIHIQHRPRQGDHGAVRDFDGDGKIEQEERERDLVAGYAAAMARELEAQQIGTLTLDSASMAWVPERYSEVWELIERDFNARLACDPKTRGIYLACHVNAGGGGYGLVGYDSRSRGGRGAAGRIAGAMRAEFLELSSVKVAGLVGSDAISPRGLDCILGIYDLPAGISAVLLEPFFIDGPGHEHLAEPEGLARMGRAIGRGIALWWDGGR